MISLFMKNRWIGIKPILFGESAREAALDNWIMQGISTWSMHLAKAN